MASSYVTFVISDAHRKKSTSLILSGNKLISLPSELFELKNLTSLDISENQLISLPSRISTLNNLKILYAYRNQLSYLPSEIFELNNLTELYLSENQLTSLPSEISKLKNLKKLDISSNKLNILPSEFSELKNLTYLDISRNQLISLPPEISELSNLTELPAYNNQLCFLPSEMSKLKSLIKIDISKNKLSSLPLEIFELKNVTELCVSGNQLNFLPSEISNLKNLRKLDLSFNGFCSLPSEISELNYLTELDLSGNQLSSFPSAILELKNLKTLYLSQNQISSLPLEFPDLENLTELYLSQNQISSLPSGISNLKNLKKLYLSENQLSSLPLKISALRNLKKLDLSFNKFSSLTPEILDVELEIELENDWKPNIIYLYGNALENPPLEIIKRGKKAVINYLKSLEKEKKPLNEVKVLLVGDGGAGKTSLVKKLFGEDIDGNEPQTQGINIRKWTLKNGKLAIKANFWDFGGQEIMHATHQFFLSKRSLYILVLDSRKDEKPEYWLKLIENFGGDSPILLVINKIDENSAFELNRKFLSEKYSSIRGFSRLSCKSGEGIGSFSDTLKEELKAVKHLEIKWPKSWFNVKIKLEKMCPNYTSDFLDNSECEYRSFIQYNEYKKICDDEGIRNESEQNTLVDFLHDLGVILHFKDIPLLNTHVLEPEWVTNAVYRLVS